MHHFFNLLLGLWLLHSHSWSILTDKRQDTSVVCIRQRSTRTYLKFVQGQYKKCISMLFLNLCKAFDSGRRVVWYKRWQFRLEGVRRAHKGAQTFERRYEWAERRSDRAVTVRRPPPDRVHNARAIALILCERENANIYKWTVYIMYSVFRSLRMPTAETAHLSKLVHKIFTLHYGFQRKLFICT